MIGIIGGTGIYSSSIFKPNREKWFNSKRYGQASGPVMFGSIGPAQVAFLARHGSGHSFSPTYVPYRANIRALKLAGCTHILSIGAVGSYREFIPPGSVVLPDTFIDQTIHRSSTFFERPNDPVVHIDVSSPTCAALRGMLMASLQVVENNVPLPAIIPHGSYVCIEGPRFSSMGESQTYRSWPDTVVVGMTACPEVWLAREAGLHYASFCHVTDYDVWNASEEPVTVEQINQQIDQNTSMTNATLEYMFERFGDTEQYQCTCTTDQTGSVLSQARLKHGEKEILQSIFSNS